MDIASGATSLESLRSLLDASVEIRVALALPRLHAKVYIFGHDHAVVTSANLTNRAMESNLEVGVEIDQRDMDALIAWYDRIWSSSKDLKEDDLALLGEQSRKLRREYVELRKTARTRLALSEFSSRESSGSVGRLIFSAKQFFLVNTNRRYDLRTKTGGFGLEERMHDRGLAAVWESFKFPQHMRKVAKGDVIYAFAKGVGIIGIGVAKAGVEIVEGDSNDRLRLLEQHDSPEWRIPTRWLIWVDDEGAFSYRDAPNASFIDVSDEKYGELRLSIENHFLDFLE